MLGCFLVLTFDVFLNQQKEQNAGYLARQLSSRDPSITRRDPQRSESRVNRFVVFVNESVFAILYLLTRADCTPKNLS